MCETSHKFTRGTTQGKKSYNAFIFALVVSNAANDTTGGAQLSRTMRKRVRRFRSVQRAHALLAIPVAMDDGGGEELREVDLE
jgi:hypothetical protein